MNLLHQWCWLQHIFSYQNNSNIKQSKNRNIRRKVEYSCFEVIICQFTFINPIVAQKNKITNFRQYFPLQMFQNIIFAATRMRFIFITRCAGNKALFSWPQVMVNHLSRVTGVATWGRKDKAIWVKKFTVEYSVDGDKWYSYGETGLPFHFPGNFDSTTRVR